MIKCLKIVYYTCTADSLKDTGVQGLNLQMSSMYKIINVEKVVDHN